MNSAGSAQRQLQGAETTTAEAAAARSRALPLTLLNVEDFEPSRYFRTRVFRDAGYDVVEAASAREALAAATQAPLSAAIVDVHLPDASGIVLCETLKRLNPALPVLLISAVSASAEIREAGLAAGAHAYLGEPLTSETLLRSVTDALAPEAPPRVAETWILTDAQGFIIDVSPLGAQLLSGSARGLQHRSLIVFFEQDRNGWREAMMRASRGEHVIRSGRLRPKERRPIAVRVRIERAETEMRAALIWTFHTGDGD